MTDHVTPQTASGLMTLAETAGYLRAPVATLRYWRHLGSGQAGFRSGRRVMYCRQDLNRCIATQQDAEGTRR